MLIDLAGSKRKPADARRLDAHMALALKGISSGIDLKIQDTLYLMMEIEPHRGLQVVPVNVNASAVIKVLAQGDLRRVGYVCGHENEYEQADVFSSEDGKLWMKHWGAGKENPLVDVSVMALSQAESALSGRVRYSKAVEEKSGRLQAIEAWVNMYVRNQVCRHVFDCYGQEYVRVHPPHYQIVISGLGRTPDHEGWVQPVRVQAELCLETPADWPRLALSFAHDDKIGKEHLIQKLSALAADRQLDKSWPDDVIELSDIRGPDMLLRFLRALGRELSILEGQWSSATRSFSKRLAEAQNVSRIAPQACVKHENRMMSEDSSAYLAFCDKSGWAFPFSPFEVLRERLELRAGVELKPDAAPAVS